MQKYFIYYTSLIFSMSIILLHCACSGNAPSSTTISAKGYQEVQNSYNSVLKRWPVPYERKHIKTSYGNTHIITWGEKNKPPLVLFHGNGNCALIWIFVAKQLANDFYVIAPDTVSDIGLTVQTKRLNNTKDYAGWFVELINNIGLSRVHVAGISWGGGIALQAALAHPDRINRMVVMSPAFGIKSPQMGTLLHVLPVVLFPSAENVRSLFGWVCTKRPLLANKTDEGILNYHVTAFKHYKISRIVFPTVFSDKELKQIKAPVLLLIGDKEVVLPDPLTVIERAKKNLPDIEAKIISKAGHVLIYDRPDTISREMVLFLKRKTTN